MHLVLQNQLVVVSPGSDAKRQVINASLDTMADHLMWSKQHRADYQYDLILTVIQDDIRRIISGKDWTLHQLEASDLQIEPEPGWIWHRYSTIEKESYKDDDQSKHTKAVLGIIITSLYEHGAFKKEIQLAELYSVASKLSGSSATTYSKYIKRSLETLYKTKDHAISVVDLNNAKDILSKSLKSIEDILEAK